MRPNKLIVQGLYGQLYRLHRRHEAPVLGSIEAEELSDEYSAWEFIISLRTDHADWLTILDEMGAITANSDISLHYSQLDVMRLVCGWRPAITFYPLRQHIDFGGKRNNYPIIKAPQGVQYHFVPATTLLLSDPDPADVKFFKNEWQQAREFIKTLALTDEQLATIISGLTLRAWPRRADRIESLVTAFAMGDIVMVTIRESMAPPKRRGSEDLPIEEYTPRGMTLGPHDEPGYEPPPPPIVKSEIEKPSSDIPEHTYRGDSRGPDEIFKKGFEPRAKGSDASLEDYARYNSPSNYVGTSKDSEIANFFAIDYGNRDGYIYTVNPDKGVDVTKELGSRSPFPNEQEVVIPGGIKPENIKGVTPVSKDGNLGDSSILNPKFYKKPNE